MDAKLAVRPDHAVGDALVGVARDILAEARTAVDDEERADAQAVHDYRKAMKRWRALLRLIEPFIGEDGSRLRVEARDLARELAGARDAQSALDALADLGKADETLGESADRDAAQAARSRSGSRPRRPRSPRRCAGGCAPR